MNSILSIIIAFVLAQNIVAAQIQFDFGELEPTSEAFSLNGISGTSDDYCQGDGAYYFVNDNSGIEFNLSKDLENVGNSTFSYTIDEVSSTGGFRILCDVFDNESNEWLNLIDIPVKSNLPNCSEIPIDISSLKRAGLQKIRIYIHEYVNGILVLNSATFNAMPEALVEEFERTALIKEQTTSAVKDISKGLKNDINNEEAARIKNDLKQLKERYYQNIDVLARVHDYSTHIDIATSLYQLFKIRNDMANPLAYDDFNIWTTRINSFSDIAQGKFLSDLQDEFKVQRNQYDIANLPGKAKVNSIIDVVADVGNILTGGKLKSIITSGVAEKYRYIWS